MERNNNKQKRVETMQKFEMIGRLGKDLELRITKDNKKVVEFSLAETEKINNEEITTWVNFVAWESKAETLSKYLMKGDKIFVEGKLRNQKYNTKEGIERHKTFVVVNNFELLPNSRKKEEKEKVADNWSMDLRKGFDDEEMKSLDWY